MNTIEAIKARRSIRQFDATVKIDAKTERALLEAALLAPSALNLQHCRIVTVHDPKLREKLQAAAYGQKQVTQASLFVVFCANLHAWKDDAHATGEGLPEAGNQARSMVINRIYPDNPVYQRDEGVRSAAMAAQNLMLAAKDMGYDSVPMIGFDIDKVASLIQLPPNHMVVMAVAVGRAMVGPSARYGRLPYERVVFENNF